MGQTFYPQVRALLLSGNCVMIRQGKGSHEIWKSPAGKTFSVPVTLVSRHTANAILKQAGIESRV